MENYVFGKFVFCFICCEVLLLLHILRRTSDKALKYMNEIKIECKQYAKELQTQRELAKLCFGDNQNTKGDKSMKEIKIKYFTDKIDKLTYVDGKSDWIDLRAAETVVLKANQFKLIPLGVAMELPEGYEAHVVPRSSTFKNYGIIQTNHCGVIDESYCGDNDQWFFPAYALRNTVIRQNDRICQFRIFENQPKIVFDEVKTLGNADRGGHGSTGKQ